MNVEPDLSIEYLSLNSAMFSQHGEQYVCRAEYINRHAGVLKSRYRPELFEDHAQYRYEMEHDN